MGVSTRKGGEVVKTVLEGLCNVNIKSVPKKDFGSAMYMEARALSLIQAANKILDEKEVDMTVGGDGTTKYGHHYGAYDIHLSSGECLVLGVRAGVGGTAEEMLEAMKTVIEDVCLVTNDGSKVNNVIKRIKNTISDRHIVQKKFNELLQNYRRKILPTVVREWAHLTDLERESLSKMNNYFCGLHFIVGLADQAGQTLKVWEDMVFNGDQVGAQKVGVAPKGGEGGIVRLIRTVCKSIQDRGYEKSGKPVHFRAFLKERGKTLVPLAPFKGNRFDILFHDGGGVYYLRHDLKDFFADHREDYLLIKALDSDLNVPQFLTGCRALGLVNKFVTAPLWRVLEGKERITTMDERYKIMLSKFEEWAVDSSPLL
nr:uncharacterized protein LOC129255060 isoform X2 [Lytechinus pictus]